jgi:hypothetical protein
MENGVVRCYGYECARGTFKGVSIDKFGLTCPPASFIVTLETMIVQIIRDDM